MTNAKRAEDFLGFRWKDIITGLVGTATGYVNYLSGCNQVLLTPAIGADGKPIEGAWFDEQRLEAVEGERIVLDNGDAPGFDAPAPVR